jgi:hypothetical protein
VSAQAEARAAELLVRLRALTLTPQLVGKT